MNRRKLFFNSLKTLVAGAALSGQSAVANSANILSGDSNSPFIIKRAFRSKKFPNKIYKSSDEFWADHAEGDELGAKINHIMTQKKLLLGTSSDLQSDGKTLINQKIYKSKTAYEEFLRLHKQNKKSSDDDIFEITIIS
jgi:hypothetical protein